MAFGPTVPGSEHLVTGAFRETIRAPRHWWRERQKILWLILYSRPNVLFPDKIMKITQCKGHVLLQGRLHLSITCQSLAGAEIMEGSELSSLSISSQASISIENRHCAAHVKVNIKLGSDGFDTVVSHILGGQPCHTLSHFFLCFSGRWSREVKQSFFFGFFEGISLMTLTYRWQLLHIHEVTMPNIARPAPPPTSQLINQTLFFLFTPLYPHHHHAGSQWWTG